MGWRLLTWFRLVVAIALAVAIALPLAGAISAHAELIKSDPSPGAVLGAAPKQVRLWFDENVDPGFSEVQVLDRNQARVDDGRVQLAPGDSKQLATPLKALGDGTYVVVWKVLSSTDGHITRGNFSFSVGAASGGALFPVTTGTGGPTETEPLALVIRWLNLLSLLALVGVILFRILLLEPSLQVISLPEAAVAPVHQTVRQLGFAALVVALISGLAGLLVEASIAAGVSLLDLASGDALARTLADTWFGNLWIARTLLLLALAVTLRFDERNSRIVGSLLGLGALLTYSLGAHGAAAQGIFSLAVLADWIHLACVSLWVGGLFAFLASLLTLWRLAGGERGGWLAWIVPRFSQVALPAAVLIGLTGLYNSLLEVPSLDALFQTLYGETLALKVALFAVMLAFGALNLVWLSPGFRRAVASGRPAVAIARRFRLTLAAEVALGICVIFLAGLLTSAPPARTALAQPGNSNQAASPRGPEPILLVDDAAPDVEVGLAVNPDAAASLFDVYLTNPKTQSAKPPPGVPPNTGAPIPSVLRVIVRFTLLDRDIGVTTVNAESQGNGHYIVNGNYLTVPGMWLLHVTVRRAGVEDVSTDFPLYKTVERGAVTSSDPQAVALLKSSEAAMNQLQSVRSKQDLNDGTNGVVITDYEFRAPDAMRFRVQGQAESIAIGSEQYYQDRNGNWTERKRVDPLVFPSFNASAQALDVHQGRPELLNGVNTQIVRYFVADASSRGGTEYAQWISTSDHRPLQLAMVTDSHYMVQTYSDFNSPDIVISAPANAVAEAAPAPAPQPAPAPVSARARGPITGDLEADAALGMLVAGIGIGLAGASRRRKWRPLAVGASIAIIIGSIVVAAHAFNGMAAAANAPVDTSQTALGKTVYENNCAACHGETGHGDGPAGKALPVQPFDLTTHVLLHDEQYLYAVISNGRGYMPAFKDRLSQDQIFEVIAYARLLAQQAQQNGAKPGFTPQP